jgi:phage shock protein PspC (stress-responsive transcriptional regulator)
MARRLTRDTRSAVLGGVAAGFGRYLDVDPVVVRLAFVLAVLFGGVGLLFYIVCWAIIPRDEASPAPPPPAAGGEPPAAPGEAPLDRMAGELRQAGGALRRQLDDSAPGVSGPRLVIGLFLVILGGVLLLDELHWIHWPHWVRIATLWPTILIALGIALLVRQRGERPQ